MNEFTVEYSCHLAIIMNKIALTGDWLSEYQTTIPKIKPAAVESDVRLISCTAFASKLYESFIRDWLWPFVGPHIDPANFGGMKGLSTMHLLLKLLHFIHSNVDRSQPHAVLLVQADLEKAFNRV